MYGINVVLKLHSIVNRLYRLIQQCVISVKAYTAVYSQWEIRNNVGPKTEPCGTPEDTS